MRLQDENGSKKQVTYDWAGRVSNVVEDPLGLNYTTDYQYDALDNLSVVMQGSGTDVQGRQFTYNGLSRLVSAVNPESGTVTYVYDKVGNLLSRTDGRQITTTYTYDLVNRLTNKTSSDSSVNLSWNYDAGTNNVGRLVAANAPASTTTYSYDAQGRVVTSTQSTAGQAYAFGYVYNAAGSLTSETYPSGRVAAQSYDVLDRVTGVTGTQNAAVTNYGSVLSYVPHGAVGSMRYGNTVQTDQEYDAQLRPMDRITQANNYGYIYAILYTTWAGNGNLASSEGYESGNGQFLTMSHFTQSYGYDAVNRLTSITDSGYNRTFGYDRYGNQSVTANNGVPWSGLTPYSGGGANPFNPANNRLNAGVYDAVGNQTVVGSLQLGYDADNRQVVAQDGTNPAYNYAYDGNGQRVVKTLASGGTTVYVYDALGRLAAEYTDGAAAAAPCRTCYLSADHLGSVRLVTDEARLVVGQHDYLPFGEEIPGNTAGRDGTFGGFENVRQRFTGTERDETNLDFFQARYSAATLGRFLSPDPANAGADLLNPQSWNGYSYVLNNPLTLVDPSGLYAEQNPRPAPEPDPGPDPGDFFNYCFFFSCGRGGLGLGDGPATKPPPVFLQPVKNNLRIGQDGKSGNLGLTGRQACYADALVNGALGFVPGYNATKTVASLAGFNFNPVQFANGDTGALTGASSGATPFATGSPTVPQTAAGIASAGALYADARYAAGGGVAALSRAQDLVSRSSFALRSSSGQASLLQQAASIERLAQVASAAKNLGTVFSLASTAFDLYQCSQKP